MIQAMPERKRFFSVDVLPKQSRKINTIMSGKRFPAIMQLPGSEMQRGVIGSEGSEDQQMMKRTRGKC